MSIGRSLSFVSRGVGGVLYGISGQALQRTGLGMKAGYFLLSLKHRHLCRLASLLQAEDLNVEENGSGRRTQRRQVLDGVGGNLA